jgi:hypothetical protein
MNNPFVLLPYYSKEFFCDREDELSRIESCILNGVNITLISPRRMGKTGLIYRFFDKVKEESLPYYTIYIDIFSSISLSDFIKILTESVLTRFPENTSVGKKFMKFIRSLRPVLSFDPITNLPQISISFQTDQEKELTLKNILDFLNSQDKKVVLAIDEFQQIREYDNLNMEALLRTYIQGLENVNFIFCGSKRHIMMDIFSNATNPFYSSTRFLSLSFIDRDKYFEFIRRHFLSYGKIVEDEAVDFILDWTRRHTYYTQSLCNYVFANSIKMVNLNDVKTLALDILSLNECVYLQYRELLTNAQWNYLIAIAKEDKVYQPMSNDFLRKYNIGTPANSKRLLNSLMDKELILNNITKQGVEYMVYDVFLSHWLKRL